MYVVIRQHTVSSFVHVVHMDISMSHLHLSSRGTRQMLQASWGASLTMITCVDIWCVISVCYSIVTIATNE